jgi:beta-N-acetylhexosaminidase
MGFSLKRYFLFISLLILFLSSCQTSIQNPEKTNEKPLKSYSILEKPEKVVKIISLAEFKNSNIDFNSLAEEQQNILIDSMIKEMNMDEKIGQLFMLAVRHTAYGEPAYDADDYIKDYMDRYLPGGIILFTINFKDPHQTRTMIQKLQDHSPYPLFIATDEEGGKVSRLGSTEAMEVISLPPASELSRYDSPELTEFAASVLAEDMRDLGFNMDMAPVADLRNRGKHDVIGTRSFGSDPELNAAMIASFVKGLQNNGISSVLKHFPGHGNVSGDSHDGAVSSLSSAEDFSKKEFVSFISGIAAGADFVLTAHIAAPALSGDSIPASLSPVIQTEILREQLGFEGIIITDAMDMGAIKNLYSPEEASLTAILAGTDIILMPEHIPSAQQSIRDALEDGRLSEERLYLSLKRIIKLKFKKGMFNLNHEYIKKISNTHKNLRHEALETRLKTK